MATKSKSTELAVIEPDEYPVIFDTETSLAAVLTENFGGAEGLSPNDLDRIKVPTGGGTAWEVPSLEGPEMVKDLEGIILAYSANRKYWAVDLDDSDGNNPPDCFSDDAKVGVGMFGPGSDQNPSGDCSDCPMSEWGSKNGDGRGPQACREGRMLYLLRPNNVLPVVVQLPATSITPLKKYLLQLTNAQKSYWSVVTNLGLEQKSDRGLKWSTVVPTVASKVGDEQLAEVKSYADSVKAIATRTRTAAPSGD